MPLPVLDWFKSHFVNAWYPAENAAAGECANTEDYEELLNEERAGFVISKLPPAENEEIVSFITSGAARDPETFARALRLLSSQRKRPLPQT